MSGIVCVSETLPAHAQWEGDPTRPGRNIQQELLLLLSLCHLCWVSSKGQHLLQPGSWWHQAGQCACGTLEPLPRQTVAHTVESRLYLSVPGLQQSLTIPNSSFSCFCLLIIIPRHPHGVIQPWHRTRGDPLSHTEQHQASAGVTLNSQPEGEPVKKRVVCKTDSWLIPHAQLS